MIVTTVVVAMAVVAVAEATRVAVQAVDRYRMGRIRDEEYDLVEQ